MKTASDENILVLTPDLTDIFDKTYQTKGLGFSNEKNLEMKTSGDFSLSLETNSLSPNCHPLIGLIIPAFRRFLDFPFLPNAPAHEEDSHDWTRISKSTTARSPSLLGEGWGEVEKAN